ncbi:MAG: CDP-archaeol synthase [Gammaproteobacteria bacterium]|jgi:CDP-2,3-bis-(O-geranylgeranyl)-sn-glycerol synthase
MLEVKLLLLIGIANGTPVVVKKLLGDLWAYPLDGNRTFLDQRPVFGPSKTIRGIAFSGLFTAIFAPMFAIPWVYGLIIAATAMAGDLFSSFIKRRCGKPSSSMALGIDQIPESLLPMIAAHYVLDVSWFGVFVVVVLFFVLELVVSKILYKFNIRNEPY